MAGTGRRGGKSPRMSPRTRKLVGTVLMIVLVLFWALGAMALAQGRITTLPGYLQFVAYLLLGLGWVLPAGVLIRWMQKDDVRPETL